MIGLGLWHIRRLGEGGGRLALAGLVIVAAAIAAACGGQLAQTTEPTATPIVPLPSQTTITPRTASGTSFSPSESPGSQLSPSSLASLPSIAALVDRVEPAVASISVEAISRGLFFDFTDEGAGTGIVVRPDGYIVTNYHVIQNANGIQVNLPSGESYDATIVGADIVTDLAVLKIEAQDLPTATFANSNAIRVGDWVVALGNALALKGGPSVTLGIISARGRTVTTERGPLYDLIQTDAAINDGNSGGPLVNLDGEIVGVITAILRQSQGIGFAVSSSTVVPIIDSLIEHGRVVRPAIGLLGEDVTPARANRLGLNVDEGIFITNISPDGPAGRAGIRVGDVITRIDETRTPDMARFLTLLWTYNVGDTVQVEYIRDNQTYVVEVTLDERQ